MDESGKTISDSDKRNFIIDVLGVGRNTVADMTGKDLEKAYSKALNDAEKKNMGGMMTDELGYMQGGMTEKARGPIKYSKGGAIAGKNFRGSF